MKSILKCARFYYSSYKGLWKYPFPKTSFDVNKYIVDSFNAPILYSFAYGSGVFKQKCTSDEHNDKKMIDMIFVVKSAKDFHTQTLIQYPDHYSSISRLFSPSILAYITNNFGARIYYNTYCNISDSTTVNNDVIFKYGVIQEDHFLSDLRHWDTLYVAGRLQKPVKLLLPRNSNSDNESLLKLEAAMYKNLASALCYASYLASNNLHSKFSLKDLHLQIVGLSYLGDARRFMFAEDPGKIKKILNGLYQLDAANGSREVSKSSFDSTVFGLWYKQIYENNLSLFKGENQAFEIIPREFENLNSSDLMTRKLYNPKLQLFLISFWPGLIQSLKGIFSAGPFNALIYIQRKIRKRFWP